jgi:hypothetical protein
MSVVVLNGRLPFTLTIDTEAGEVTEYLVDGYSYELDEDYAEDRTEGAQIKDKALIAKAIQIANEGEWPGMEEM